MATKTKVTKTAQKKVLALVAAWLGPKMGYEGPAPTGKQAAYTAAGPMLNPAWDWPSSGPTPTILLEGGPYDWAVEVSMDEEVIAKALSYGVFIEPYAGYALCLYPYD